MDFKDYYKVLGVGRDATDDEIKKAFRKLARKCHPDVAKDKPGAEDQFKEINEAYEVLGNPENRRKYDELGSNWRQGAGFRPPPEWQFSGGQGMGGGAQEFHFSGTGFSDFFEQFFGRSGRFSGFGDEAGGQGARTAMRGPDMEGDILVTLEEALRGSVRTVAVRRMDRTTGREETHQFKVRIPAGIQESQTVRIPGKGHHGSGGAGDLFLRVRLAAHPEFHPRGTDLLHDLDLAPWEAVLGTTVEVPTLDGSVQVRIPAGTPAGQTLRVRGQGLPQGGGTRGDLFVTVTLQVPSEVTEEQKALWERLAVESKFNPRKKG